MPSDEKLPPARVQMDRYVALTMTWADGTQSVLPIDYLRSECPCATCREFRETPPDPFRVIQKDADVSAGAVHVESMEPVGHYALRLQFSDGHGSGIYSYQYLAELQPPGSDS